MIEQLGKDPRVLIFALCQAAACGDHETMIELIQQGLSPEARREIELSNGRKGFSTPLHSAAGAGQSKSIELLCEYGAGINLLDGLQRTPLVIWLRSCDGILMEDALPIVSPKRGISEAMWDTGVEILSRGGHIGPEELYALSGGTSQSFLQRHASFQSLLQQAQARLDAKALDTHTPDSSSTRANRL